MEFINLKKQQEILKDELDSRISNVLSHGQYIMGPEIKELESKLCEYTESKYCITVSSGTEALLISLMALEIGIGDEIITTPFTFVSTAEVIALLGAKPVFVDIDPQSCNLDPTGIESSISDKTKAIMPVSLYGQPADMGQINEIAAKHHLPVIEDAAQSFGSVQDKRKSCNLSTIGCTSFFPSKPLGCYGDGGAIFTNSPEIAEAARAIRVHGQKERYIFSSIGVGGRMDTLQAAVVLAKLTIFDKEVELRHEIGEKYNKIFDQLGIDRVKQKSNTSSVFAQYTIFIEQREKVVKSLNRDGIPTSIHYPLPLNQQPAYKGLCSNETPISSNISKTVLSLPMGPYLTKTEQEKVVKSLEVSLKNETV